MNKRNKIILISLLSTIFVLILVIGITKSFMKPIEEGGNITEVSLNSCAKIKLTSTSNVNLSSSYPMSRNRGLQTTPYKFTVTSYCDSYVGFNLYIATLNTNTIDTKYVRYILTESGTKNVIQEGILSSAETAETDFTDTEKTELNTGIKGTYGNIYKIYNDKIPLKGSNSYDLYLFLDGDTADNTTMGKTFKAGIAVKSYDRENNYHEDCNDDSIACHIAKVYTGTQGENGLYYHNSSLTNGAEDNSYRYAGANPNNYVCFGSDGTTCPYENLYRIIGVIDEKVKLISADGGTTDMLGTDGEYYKTYSSEGLSTSSYKGSGDLSKIGLYHWGEGNSWSYSPANTTNLNKNYLTYLDSKNTKWKNMIDDTTWNVGGMTYDNGVKSNAKTAYDYEVGANKDTSTTVTSKIGLMYLSDYYYGSSPEYWVLPGYDQNGSWDTESYIWLGEDYSKAYNDNWLHIGLSEWTISPDYINSFGDGNSEYIIYVSKSGRVSDTTTTGINILRPSFSLTSSVQHASGDGTISNPIRLKI